MKWLFFSSNDVAPPVRRNHSRIWWTPVPSRVAKSPDVTAFYQACMSIAVLHIFFAFTQERTASRTHTSNWHFRRINVPQQHAITHSPPARNVDFRNCGSQSFSLRPDVVLLGIVWLPMSGRRTASQLHFGGFGVFCGSNGTFAACVMSIRLHMVSNISTHCIVNVFNLVTCHMLGVVLYSIIIWRTTHGPGSRSSVIWFTVMDTTSTRPAANAPHQVLPSLVFW